MPFVLALFLLHSGAGAVKAANPVPAPLPVNPLVQAFEDALAAVIERSKPAVVALSARDVLPPALLRRLMEAERIPLTSGSAFFFRPEGYLLTNDHVVHSATSVEIRLADRRTLRATVVGTDPNTDIAVLKVDAKEPFPVLPLGDSARIRVGQFVLSIGSPFGLDSSVTIGIVSATGRDVGQDPTSLMIRYQDFIQTDAYINRGNSGGPLLNLRGEVIGMNSMIRTGLESDYSGVGFAIPANMLRTIAEQLIQNGRVIRGWLGIGMRPADGGIRVTQVQPDTPAQRGGLRSGDLITAFNGRAVQNTKEFSWMIANAPVGRKVRLAVQRGGSPIEVEVLIGEMPPERAGREEIPEAPQLAQLGLRLQALPPEFAEIHGFSEEDTGALVIRVEPESPAHKAGILPGELVYQVDGKVIQTPAEGESAIADALGRGETKILLAVKSKEGPRLVEIPLESLIPSPGGRQGK